MIDRHGQDGDQEIAFGKTHAQEFRGQRRGEAVEIEPGDDAPGFGGEEGGSMGAFPGPFGEDKV